MTWSSLSQTLVLLALLVAISKPLGAFMARVFEGGQIPRKYIKMNPAVRVGFEATYGVDNTQLIDFAMSTIGTMLWMHGIVAQNPAQGHSPIIPLTCA